MLATGSQTQGTRRKREICLTPAQISFGKDFQSCLFACHAGSAAGPRNYKTWEQMTVLLVLLWGHSGERALAISKWKQSVTESVKDYKEKRMTGVLSKTGQRQIFCLTLIISPIVREKELWCVWSHCTSATWGDITEVHPHTHKGTRRDKATRGVATSSGWVCISQCAWAQQCVPVTGMVPWPQCLY